MSQLLTFLIENDDNFRRQRLPSLYSDFTPQKTTNPDGYAANIAAWQEGLANAAWNGMLPAGPDGQKSLLVLRVGPELSRELDCPGLGRPAALGAVVDESTQSRSMLSVHDFHHGKASIYTEHWTAPSIINPITMLSWGARTLTGLVGLGSGAPATAGADSKLATGEYVLIPNLEEVAGQVLQQVSRQSSSAVDHIYSVDLFKNEFREVSDGDGMEREMSEVDIKALLKYLSRDREEIAYDGQTIKFKLDTEAAITPLTHSDTSIANLKTVIAKLSSQIKQLDRRISELTTAASAAVKSSNRVSALSSLRSRKLAERSLAQRSDTLAQLEDVYNSIEAAASQVEIVDVMRSSTSVLKTLHAKTGGVEKVEDVVEALREEMSKVEEVGGVLNEAVTGAGSNAVDEDEVDEELRLLEEEESKEKEEVEAEKTRKRLEELERVEREAKEKKEKEDAAAAAAAKATEAELEEKMSRVSVEEEPEKEKTATASQA